MEGEIRFHDPAAPAAGGADGLALAKTIRRMIRAIDVRSKEIARGTGLTIPQIVVLAAIRDLGEVTTLALARHVDLSAATVVTILDKIEARGFVERYRSKVDRRIVHARLTPSGAAALAAAPSLLPASLISAFAGRPEAERKLIVDAFAFVAEKMEPPRQS